MNILLVNWMDSANPAAGGAEVHLYELFRRFVDRGDRVTLAASGFPGCASEDEHEGIRVVRSGTRESFNYTLPSLLRRLDRETPFDLVVEDINKVPFFTPLYLRRPLMVIVPHLFGTAIFREANPLIASYVYLMERPIPWVYRRALFEVISDSTAHDIVRRGIGRDRIRTVHCGMDHDTYTIDPDVTKFDTPTMLYVGRLKRYKGADIAVRALPLVREHVTNARLTVVGSGDDESRLRRLADSLGVGENVIFTGYVSTEEKVDWYRRSHVIVNPSPKEGWGLTNIEANACGTPAVASDADGLRDSVVDGVTGLLFPYGDHAALAERATRILMDDALRSRFTAAALERARSFTWDESARLTMDVAAETIDRHRS
jgi:glycosyltransferase involved in cell wall biosynthesis